MIIYVDLDDTVANYTKAYNAKKDTIQYPQAEYGFFENLELIPDARKAICTLEWMGHEVWFLTRPSIKNPLCYTEKRNWVEKHFGLPMVDRLIISPNKTLLRGDFLIDDQHWDFAGGLIRFGSEPFPDWASIVDFFKKITLLGTYNPV